MTYREGGKVMHEGSLETRPICTVSRKQSFRCSSCPCQRHTFFVQKKDGPVDMCRPADNDPLSQGALDEPSWFWEWPRVGRRGRPHVLYTGLARTAALFFTSDVITEVTHRVI